MKIIKSYMGTTSTEEARLKEKFTLHGVEFATARDSSRLYPFRAYHYASGQPVGDSKKLFKEVREAVEKEVDKLFSAEKWANFTQKISTLEIINPK